MRFALALVLLFSMTTLVLAQQQRLALVIGNSDYPSAPLRNPTNDAQAMSAKLTQLGFKVIRVTNGTYRDMITALNKFANELNRYDVGLFYYSGHGVQYQGANYLIPVDADIQRAVDIQFEALNAAQVLADMESSGTQVNIMMLDACRNNPFVTQFRSFTRGLSVVQAPAGSLVVYSTAPDQVALDGGGANSPFTAALLHNMGTPGVSIQDMLTGVFQQVQQTTGGKQVPWESSSLTAPFYFVSGPPAVAAAPPPQPVAAASRPSQPQGSGATSSAPAQSSVQPGQDSSVARVVIQIKQNEQPKLGSRVTFNGSGGSRTFTVAQGDTQTTASLGAGTYTVSASFQDDPGVGYKSNVVLHGGEQNIVQIPLTHSPQFRISALQNQRALYDSELRGLQQQQVNKGRQSTALTLFGIASGVVAGVTYLAGESAYGAYQAATVASAAENYRLQTMTFGTLTIAGGIGGAVLLLWGIGTYSSRPSDQSVYDLKNSISRLDAQIKALSAEATVQE